MRKCLSVLLTSAFIGGIVPPILLYIGGVLPRLSKYFGSSDFLTLTYLARFDYVMVTLWPSSIFLMLLDGPDRSRDGEILTISILLNALLYSVIGLTGFAIWFLVRRRTRKNAGASGDA
jgi:hypothetical protein